jgi:hypothetical protein
VVVSVLALAVVAGGLFMVLRPAVAYAQGSGQGRGSVVQCPMSDGGENGQVNCPHLGNSTGNGSTNCPMAGDGTGNGAQTCPHLGNGQGNGSNTCPMRDGRGSNAGTSNSGFNGMMGRGWVRS